MDSNTHLQSVAVIIPALNEEASLPLVLNDLPDVGTVIVVDNGSDDQTAAVARAANAVVVHESRRGYGQACLQGMQELQRLVTDASIEDPRVIVFLDADYSDHPEYLTALVDPILSGQADMVLGSRLTGVREPGAMPPQSIHGNRLACGLIRLLFGHRYTDLGPFRAIRHDALRQLGMVDRNYGWTVEMQIKALRNGLRILEIPVPYRRRIGVSKISGTFTGTIKASWKILSTIARYGVWRTRPVNASPRVSVSNE